MKTRSSTQTRFVALVAGFLVTATAAQAAVTIFQLDTNWYGRVDQANVSMPNSVTNELGGGANSCVPTSVGNGLRFLQTTYPAVYGTAIVPGLTVDTAVDIGRNFTSTTSDLGTTGANWVAGRQNYVEAKKPGVSQYGSTENNFVAFMTTWFPRYAAMEIGILPRDGGIGHALTLTGFRWNDLNNDGIIQQNENAILRLIDPFAPAGNLEMSLWKDGADYRVTYSGIDYNLVLMNAVSPTVIPAPGSFALLGMGTLVAVRRRR
ncbi:MAG: PEP-CTERM sorting domain-containing protein [Phycisphaeraceae bacterium]|nr:PEP-CTERM sorting domain-containing protein [Phycisphaeraceae bacterium]